jgi:hypothetical protein
VSVFLSLNKYIIIINLNLFFFFFFFFFNFVVCSCWLSVDGYTWAITNTVALIM